jgi:hypothetical protein
MSWDANNPEPDGYQVLQRMEGEEYDYANPVWPADGKNHTETTYAITNLTPGATYYFVVRAYIGSNQSDNSNEISYTVPSAVALTSITIGGPIQVDENGSAQYTCTANYSDGSTATPAGGITWSENSADTTINSDGLLTAASIAADTTVTITAVYEGISDTHTVTVKKAPATLANLSITGPTQLDEGSTAQYTCTANYSDNKSAIVTDSVQWSVNSNDANINDTGLIVAGTVQTETQVTITASIEGKQADHILTINNLYENFALTIDILGAGFVHLDPPGGTYESGTVVTLTAEPDDAYVFEGWIGNVADTESSMTSVVLNTDINLSASFLEDTDLDSVPDIEEWGQDSQDTYYDGNSDGIADYLQSNVTSIHANDEQHYLTLSVPEPGRIAACKVNDPATVGKPPTDFILPLGLITFNIDNIAPGTKTTLTIFLPAESEFDSFHKYGATEENPTEHWYEFMYDDISGTGSVYEDDTLKLYLKDGQRGDNDLSTNGAISAPGGPAILLSDDNTDPTPNDEYQLVSVHPIIGKF